MENVIQITRPPEPTLHNPYAQVVWIFFQVERENEEPTAATFRYAKNKYIEYLDETRAGYAELKENPRFYLHKHWETDTLIRFCKWLGESRLTSKTRYGIYKAVRQVMDFAHAVRLIDNVVYPPPVYKGTRETDSRSAYDEEAQEVINAALARWIGLATSMLQGYECDPDCESHVITERGGLALRARRDHAIGKAHSESNPQYKVIWMGLADKLGRHVEKLDGAQHV